MLLWLCTQDGGRDGISEILDRLQKKRRSTAGFWRARFKIQGTRQEPSDASEITGGVLKVKQMLGEEKADQIRIYSGAKFEV